MPALASFLLGEDGGITDATIEHYRRRAAGGPAMVMMEACAVSPEGVVSPNQARIYEDRFIDGMSKIANAIKSEGAIPAVQIHHGGRQTSAKVIKRKPLAPSPLPCPAIRGDVEPLTIDGIQDLVCIGRGLLADPDMPRKAKAARFDEIRTCIACNTCMQSIFKRGRIECLVNPMLGREQEMAFIPTKTPRKVMVIGGGPGGLNVAWVAAKRGHEVHQIGDCLEPRTAKVAIFESAVLGRKI